MSAARLVFLLCCAPALFACSCITSFSPCSEVKMTDLVFIGTVESVTNAKTILDSAKTPEEIQAIKAGYVFQENSATLRIRTIFRRPADQPNDDDDQNKSKTGQATPTPKDPNNDLKDGDTVVIWTDTDDCGFDFRTGETYLVYAIENEQDTRLETSACTRTARVSDSGEDLAYLYFYQNGGAQSARLEGFATSDVRKLSPDRFHYTGRIDSPVSGIRVELQSGHNSFTTTPDANGRFVFDGLAEGEYKLFAYPRDTERSKPLAPPVTLRIQAKSCTSTVLFVPKTN